MKGASPLNNVWAPATIQRSERLPTSPSGTLPSPSSTGSDSHTGSVPSLGMPLDMEQHKRILSDKQSKKWRPQIQDYLETLSWTDEASMYTMGIIGVACIVACIGISWALWMDVNMVWLKPYWTAANEYYESMTVMTGLGVCGFLALAYAYYRNHHHLSQRDEELKEKDRLLQQLSSQQVAVAARLEGETELTIPPPPPPPRDAPPGVIEGKPAVEPTLTTVIQRQSPRPSSPIEETTTTASSSDSTSDSNANLLARRISIQGSIQHNGHCGTVVKYLADKNKWGVRVDNGALVCVGREQFVLLPDNKIAEGQRAGPRTVLKKADSSSFQSPTGPDATGARDDSPTTVTTTFPTPRNSTVTNSSRPVSTRSSELSESNNGRSTASSQADSQSPLTPPLMEENVLTKHDLEKLERRGASKRPAADAADTNENQPNKKFKTHKGPQSVSSKKAEPETQQEQEWRSSNYETLIGTIYKRVEEMTQTFALDRDQRAQAQKQQMEARESFEKKIAKSLDKCKAEISTMRQYIKKVEDEFTTTCRLMKMQQKREQEDLQSKLSRKSASSDNSNPNSNGNNQAHPHNNGHSNSNHNHDRSHGQNRNSDRSHHNHPDHNRNQPHHRKYHTNRPKMNPERSNFLFQQVDCTDLLARDSKRLQNDYIHRNDEFYLLREGRLEAVRIEDAWSRGLRVRTCDDQELNLLRAGAAAVTGIHRETLSEMEKRFQSVKTREQQEREQRQQQVPVVQHQPMHHQLLTPHTVRNGVPVDQLPQHYMPVGHTMTTAHGQMPGPPLMQQMTPNGPIPITFVQPGLWQQSQMTPGGHPQQMTPGGHPQQMAQSQITPGMPRQIHQNVPPNGIHQMQPPRSSIPPMQHQSGGSREMSTESVISIQTDYILDPRK